MKTNPNEGINPERNLIPKSKTGLGHVVEYGMTNIGGLTKREYFSVLILQGLASNSTRDYSMVEFAESAVNQADELIKALNK